MQLQLFEKPGSKVAISTSAVRPKKTFPEIGELVSNRRFFFPPYQLSPVPEKEWEGLLGGKLNIFDVQTLKQKIRDEVGYSREELFTGINNLNVQKLTPEECYLLLADQLKDAQEKLQAYPMYDVPQEAIERLEALEGHIKVELAITLLELAYADAAKRKSGHDWISHPLRAGLFVAAIGGGADLVVTALLHDIVEDTRDKGHKGIRYKVPGFAEGTDWADDKKFWHLEELFGMQVASDIRRLTRDPASKKAIEDAWGKAEKKEYWKYVARVNETVGAAVAKPADGMENFWELDIPNKKLRKGMIERTIDKGAMQVPYTRKLFWLINYMLLEGIGAYSKDEKIMRKLRSFSEKDVADYEKGAVIVGERKLKRKLLEQVPDSGVPVMVVYKKPFGHVEIELPYLDPKSGEHRKIAKAIASRLGAANDSIEFAGTLLIPRMRKAIFLRFESPIRKVRKNLEPAAAIYKNAISGEMRILGVEDRGIHARMARQSIYYEPNIRKWSAGTRLRENGASQARQEQLEIFAPAKPRSIVRKAASIASGFLSVPLLE